MLNDKKKPHLRAVAKLISDVVLSDSPDRISAAIENPLTPRWLIYYFLSKSETSHRYFRTRIAAVKSGKLSDRQLYRTIKQDKALSYISVTAISQMSSHKSVEKAVKYVLSQTFWFFSRDMLRSRPVSEQEIFHNPAFTAELTRKLIDEAFEKLYSAEETLNAGPYAERIGILLNNTCLSDSDVEEYCEKLSQHLTTLRYYQREILTAVADNQNANPEILAKFVQTNEHLIIRYKNRESVIKPISSLMRRYLEAEQVEVAEEMPYAYIIKIGLLHLSEKEEVRGD